MKKDWQLQQAKPCLKLIINQETRIVVTLLLNNNELSMGNYFLNV